MDALVPCQWMLGCTCYDLVESKKAGPTGLLSCSNPGDLGPGWTQL